MTSTNWQTRATVAPTGVECVGHWAAVSAPARIDALIRSIAHCTFDMCLAGVTAGGRTSDRPIGLGEEVLNWVHRERAKSLDAGSLAAVWCVGESEASSPGRMVVLLEYLIESHGIYDVYCMDGRRSGT